MTNYRLFISESKSINKGKPLIIINNKYANMPFQILLFKRRVCIVYRGATKINEEAVFTAARGIFKVTAKYALLLFILFNKAILKPKYIFLQDKTGELFPIKQRIYSLFDNREMYDFNLNTKNQVVNIPLLTNEHQQEAPYVILANYIMATTQKYEIEKFNYLWRAYNSFYKRLFEIKIKSETKQEVEQLAFLEAYLTGQENFYIKGENTISKEKRNNYITKFTNEKVLEKYCLSKENKLSSDFSDFLIQINYKYSIDIFVQTQLAYYYRCNIFHGDSFPGLFLIKEDIHYMAIKIINKLLKNTIETKFEEILTLHLLEESRRK